MMYEHWHTIKGNRFRVDPDDVQTAIGVHFPPIPIQECCNLLSIQVVLADPKENYQWYTHAKTLEKDKRAIIWVNTLWTQDPAVDKYLWRYAIAYMLGHIFLNPTGTNMTYAGLQKDEKEKNEKLEEFALAFLIPEHLLLGRSAHYGRSVTALAKVFGVEPNMMRKRMEGMRVYQGLHINP